MKPVLNNPALLNDPAGNHETRNTNKMPGNAVDVGFGDNRMPRDAVVLLSGGLDSTTTLYYALNKGFKPVCLIFDYDQRHRKEINAARSIARKAGTPFYIIKFHLPWGGSSLIDKKMKLPVRSISEIMQFKHTATEHTRPPSTYVPGRNTIFLAFAVSVAETIKAKRIFIGANCLDFSGYPDCRPGYFNAFNKLTPPNIKIETPLLKMSKSEIILLGKELGVPFHRTWSCYAGGAKPCGRCDSCKLRNKGFKEAGVFQ